MKVAINWTFMRETETEKGKRIWGRD